MKLRVWRYELAMAHRWAIARGLGPGGEGGSDGFTVVFVELTDKDGVVGIGEAATSARYGETPTSAQSFMEWVNPYQLSFTDIKTSMVYLDKVAPGQYGAKCALNIALLDGRAKLAGKPVHEFLEVGFTEGKHTTSFSIGIASPEEIKLKVQAAEGYPILKLKVGGPGDREVLAALREVAPTKLVRVDANEGWKTKEEALRNLEWLAADGNIQFVEQPMPAGTVPEDLIWLKERSPLPLMADESYKNASDIELCEACFHAVNVKLVKAGGILAGLEALRTARKAGLKTMLGCMIESSVLITAAAHLAEWTDYLDIDGNLLVKNDPYVGVSAHQGVISFASAPNRVGLCVGPRVQA